MTISARPASSAVARDPDPPPFGAFAPTRAQLAVIRSAQRSRFRRGIFRPTLSRLVELLRAGPIDFEYQNARFRFHHQANATERGALFDPDYNLEELDFLRANTPHGGVFVDIGANVGTFAIVMARHVGAVGKVIAIEPHPIIHARLSFNCAASGCEQIRLVAAAAGEEMGDVWIETVNANLGASRVVEHASGQAIRVPMLPLQHILDDNDVTRIDALKIDVEGYEDRVLTGFFKDAPSPLHPRALVIEHLAQDRWRTDCLADLCARGYVEIGRTRSNTLLKLR